MAALKAISPQRKTAIVLVNLGGPDSLDAVQPFLFNLFNDPAIISLPNPFRRLLASFISRRRQSTAKVIYEELGGKSPILENTEAQAKALEASLAGHGQVKVFMAMRYWHPFAAETAREVKGFALLDGARGAEPADVDALAAALSRLSVFAHENAERIESIDINPFLVLPKGQGGFAVDAVIIPGK